MQNQNKQLVLIGPGGIGKSMKMNLIRAGYDLYHASRRELIQADEMRFPG